jgi:hypothetical protein
MGQERQGKQRERWVALVVVMVAEVADVQYNLSLFWLLVVNTC